MSKNYQQQLSNRVATSDDTISAYWPPRWSYERLINADASEVFKLPSHEIKCMYDSLRAVIGVDRFHGLVRGNDTSPEWGRMRPEFVKLV